MRKMRAKIISVGLFGAAVMLPIDLAKADQLGHASWYSLPANKTANGEQMDPNELTAAHRSLPFGSRVLVENLSNGSFVVVRINDRGPYIGGRIIDLSKAAAASIGIIGDGTAKVRVIPVGGGALAALGEATAKAKDGASKAAMAKVDIAPLGEAAAKAKDGASKAVTAKVDIAPAETPKAMHANGIRAVSFEASQLSSRRILVASNENPYAILGTTPGFMRPARSRRAG